MAEIRQAADIVDIVSETVILKKAGKNLSGLCPFHSEKTPSFTVSPEKQIFHCFGCGAGGDVFSFVMKRDGLSFGEAVRALARRCGVALPEKPLAPAERRRLDERRQLFEVNRRALEFYEAALARHPDASRARDYLDRRGIRPETIAAFRLGYAPKGWDNLLAHLGRHGVPPSLLEKAGLIVARREGGGWYDRFRERIIFPILNEASEVVGFGGRVLDDSLPKYLNSPETPVYSKRRTLYGLNRAQEKCRALGSVFIVEGYLDLIALHQAGHVNVVATLGTALTAEHVQRLKRLAERLVLVYDSDEAGLRSAHRCIDLFWKEHVDFRRGDVFREEHADTRILVLPQGHDPDSFVREQGPEAFQRLADEAPGIVTFLLESAVRHHGLSPEGKMRVVAELMAPLQAVNDPVAQALYIQRLAERLGLSEGVVRRRLQEVSRRSQKAVFPEKSPEAATPPPATDKFEERILAMMLHFPEILDEIRSRSVLAEFENPRLKRLGETILSRGRGAAERLPEFLQSIADEQERRLIAALAVQDEAWNLKGCRLLLNRFFAMRRGARADDRLERQIAAAERANDEEELNRLLIQKQLLSGRRGRRPTTAGANDRRA